jgi:hypothetical protein
MELAVVDPYTTKKDPITTKAIADVTPDPDQRILQLVAHLLRHLKDRLLANANTFGRIKTIVGNAKELRIQSLSRIKAQLTVDG